MKISKSQMKEARLQAKEARRDLIDEARNGSPEAREMLENRVSHSTVQRWMPQPGELVYDTRAGYKHKRLSLVIHSDPSTGTVTILNSDLGGAENVWFAHVRPMADDED